MNFANATIEEYERMLHELDRIFELRVNVPRGSHRALWYHEDIDILLRIIQVQAALMQASKILKEKIDEQNIEIKKQEDRLNKLAQKIEAK